MNGTIIMTVAAVIIGGCLLGAASMVLRAARVHAAAIDRQRDRRPFPAPAPEYQEDRPQRRRPRRRGRLLLLAVIAAAALYWFAGPAAAAGVSRLAHGQDGAGAETAAVLIAVGFAWLLGWSLSRRRYPRNHGW